MVNYKKKYLKYKIKYLLALIQKKYIGYFVKLPIIYHYPNNNQELIKVKKMINSRSKYMEKLFLITDNNLYLPFLNFLKTKYPTQYPSSDDNKNKNHFQNIYHSLYNTLMKIKNYYNRRRPYQIDPNISKQHLLNHPSLDKSHVTWLTPSYPAGHALQGYYLAKFLIIKHPEIKTELMKICDDIDKCRVCAGIHYSSDGEFSKFLVFKSGVYPKYGNIKEWKL